MSAAAPTLDDRRAARGKRCVQPRNGKRGWVSAPFPILTYVNIGSRQPELVFATNKTVRGIGTFLADTTRNRDSSLVSCWNEASFSEGRSHERCLSMSKAC